MRCRCSTHACRTALALRRPIHRLLATGGPTLTDWQVPISATLPPRVSWYASVHVPPARVMDHLKDAVEQRRNILISGGTGSGKTTMLNALTSYLIRKNGWC